MYWHGYVFVHIFQLFLILHRLSDGNIISQLSIILFTCRYLYLHVESTVWILVIFKSSCWCQCWWWVYIFLFFSTMEPNGTHCVGFLWVMLEYHSVYWLWGKYHWIFVFINWIFVIVSRISIWKSHGFRDGRQFIFWAFHAFGSFSPKMFQLICCCNSYKNHPVYYIQLLLFFDCCYWWWSSRITWVNCRDIEILIAITFDCRRI